MILDRLKQFIDYKGITIAAFERAIGMSNASFGKSLKSGGSIGADKLENILREFPEINSHWLLTGQGEMILKKYPDQLESTGHHVEEPGAKYGCQLCHANERVIAALQAHINTLERELHRQKVINDELQGRDNNGQKRKAG